MRRMILKILILSVIIVLLNTLALTSAKSIQPIENVTQNKSTLSNSIINKVSASIIGIKGNLYGFTQNKVSPTPKPTTFEMSGVVINKNGYILTSYNEVSLINPKTWGKNKFYLDTFLINKTQINAKFIAGDEKSGLAILKKDAKNLSPIIFSDSSKIAVNDMVFSIANPFDSNFGINISQGFVGSNAEKAGIREGDIVSKINGQEVNSVAQYISILDNLTIGQSLDIELYRGSKHKIITIQVEEYKP